MKARLFPVCLAVVLGMILAPAPVLAVGGDDDAPKNTEYGKAVTLIKAGKYQSAIPLLEKAAAKDPKNADVQNYLGYSHRKLKRFDVALKHYHAALRIAPKHRGANEYLGELYLQTGKLAKAEERLEVLDSACFLGCEEYSELKKAIADYKAGKFKTH